MNNTILISGTSSGIGATTAQLFLSKGWNVIVTMRKPGSETAFTTSEYILVTKLDVLDLSSIENAIKKRIEKSGKIDALVNNELFFDNPNVKRIRTSVAMDRMKTGMTVRLPSFIQP
jgi:NADP-dependent 3-hydroxy acid dehydrogenase YdfG